jgi:hypothetical protein
MRQINNKNKATNSYRDQYVNEKRDKMILESEYRTLLETKQKIDYDLQTCQTSINQREEDLKKVVEEKGVEVIKLTAERDAKIVEFNKLQQQKLENHNLLNQANQKLQQVNEKFEAATKMMSEQEDKFKKLLKEKLLKYGIEEFEDKPVEQTSGAPCRIEYSKGVDAIIRGWMNGKKIIPKFHDMSFVNALGFIDDPSVKLQTLPKVQADRAADLTLRLNLLFVYSDIVAPHFVGDRLTRVLRILPLKRGKRHELVHERFVKPFYYPVRSNRIEDVNFILTDEIGDTIKFGSGRVLVGLHLKHFV